MLDYVLPSNESHIQVSGKYFRILGLITGWNCDDSAEFTVDVAPNAGADPNVAPNEPADADPNPVDPNIVDPNVFDPIKPTDADPPKPTDAGSPNIAAIVIDFQ